MGTCSVRRIGGAVLVSGVAMAVASCAAATVVPVAGPAADIVALAGEWSGTYSNPDLNREGTIWFKLVEGEDHAHGDVRMIAPGSAIPYGPENPLRQPREDVQFLAITFVRVSATDVRGVLDPYWDPEAGCVAKTTFRGQLRGDRIDGTFETRLATGTVVTGRWKAARRIARDGVAQ